MRNEMINLMTKSQLIDLQKKADKRFKIQTNFAFLAVAFVLISSSNLIAHSNSNTVAPICYLICLIGIPVGLSFFWRRYLDKLKSLGSACSQCGKVFTKINSKKLISTGSCHKCGHKFFDEMSTGCSGQNQSLAIVTRAEFINAQTKANIFFKTLGFILGGVFIFLGISGFLLKSHFYHATYFRIYGLVLWLYAVVGVVVLMSSYKKKAVLLGCSCKNCGAAFTQHQALTVIDSGNCVQCGQKVFTD